MFSALEFMFGPLSIGLKVVSSMVHQKTQPSELTTDITGRDPTIDRLFKNILIQLRNIGKIKPFKRAWVDLKKTLVGFLGFRDGSAVASAVQIYCITVDSKRTMEVLKRSEYMNSELT